MTTYEVVCSTSKGLKPPNPIKLLDLRTSLKIVQGTNEHLKWYNSDNKKYTECEDIYRKI